MPTLTPNKKDLRDKAKRLRALARQADQAAGGGYDSHRADMAERSRVKSKAGREAGPLPAVVNPERKARGLASLQVFGEEYFPRRFRLPSSGPHRTTNERMQRCTDEGGLFACAMPRAFGKTTWAEVAVIRAVLYGLRKFVVIVCATSKLSARRLKAIVRELETNEALAEDFPEACHLIRALERIANRTRGQLLDGRPTRIEMTAESLTLPTVEGAPSSGAVIQVASMEGAIRGLNVSGPDGEPMRPDMVVIDDAQTRDSAKSIVQTTDREAIVTDDVLGLAGPDVTIAAVMLCTVIYPNDLSDRFLDGEKHPEWQAVRTKMLEQFPARMDLWDEYYEIRRDSFRTGDRGRRADQYLRENWEEMHRGAAVSWPERVKKGELSAVQSAMNLYYRNPRGFAAEYQNEPELEGGGGAKELLAANVASRLSGVERFAVPTDTTLITAFFDAGGQLHWYGVVAWNPQFGGAVIDYGAWPRQNRVVFEASQPRPGLEDVYRPGGVKLSEKERVYAGLRDLANDVLGRVYYREETGEEMKVDICLVDSGWLPDAVHQFVKQCQVTQVKITPSIGIARTSGRLAISEWKQQRQGEQMGYHWAIGVPESGRGRVVRFDPDAWKSELYARLTTPPGGRGYLGFYGKSASAHELIGEHCAAESAEPQMIRGITFDKWSLPQHRDNHLFDVLVGCMVGASVRGLKWDSGAAAGDPMKPREPRKKGRLSEMFAAKNGGR